MLLSAESNWCRLENIMLIADIHIYTILRKVIHINKVEANPSCSKLNSFAIIIV